MLRRATSIRGKGPGPVPAGRFRPGGNRSGNSAVLWVACAAILGSGGTTWVLADGVQEPVYASFLFLDGSLEWAPLDIGWAIEAIEALQEMENRGLQNMILLLDRDPFSSPTDVELRRSWELYRDSFREAERRGWFDPARAMEDGFHDDPSDPYHYPSSTALTDDRELVAARPEFLMYYPDPARPDRKVLAGVMYQASSIQAHGPQVGGSLTRWHKHIYGRPVCFRPDMTPQGTPVQVACEGFRSSQSPEMLHVWFIDHPLSQFASSMVVPFELIRTPTMLGEREFFEKHRELFQAEADPRPPGGAS